MPGLGAVLGAPPGAVVCVSEGMVGVHVPSILSPRCEQSDDASDDMSDTWEVLDDPWSENHQVWSTLASLPSVVSLDRDIVCRIIDVGSEPRRFGSSVRAKAD